MFTGDGCLALAGRFRLPPTVVSRPAFLSAYTVPAGAGGAAEITT